MFRKNENFPVVDAILQKQCLDASAFATLEEVGYVILIACFSTPAQGILNSPHFQILSL